MENEAKTRLTIDGQQAIAEAKKYTETVQYLANATTAAGDSMHLAGQQFAILAGAPELLEKVAAGQQHVAEAARQAADKQENLKDKTKETGGALSGFAATTKEVITGLIGFGSAAGAILGIIGHIADRFREANRAAADFGVDLAKLVAKYGAVNAGKLDAEAIKLSAQYGLDLKQMRGMALGMDLENRPIAEQVAAFRQAAKVAKATGGNYEAGGLVGNVIKATGMTPEKTGETITSLTNADIDASTIDVLVGRYGKQALPFLRRAAAARETGLTHTDRRQLQNFVNALMAQGEYGQVAPQLMRLGITQDMDLEQRMQFLMSHPNLNQGMLAGGIGGFQNLNMYEALRRAQAAGLVGKTSARTMDTIIAEMGQNQFINASTAQATAQVIGEQNRAEQGKRVSSTPTAWDKWAAENGDSMLYWPGFLYSEMTESLGKSFVQPVENTMNKLFGRSRGIIIDNSTHIGTNYNAGNPYTATPKVPTE